MASNLLASLLRIGGSRVLDRTLKKVLPGGEDRSAAKGRGSPLVGGLVGAAATRIAMKSVPGAIIIGGGLLAKTLYDRRRKPQAEADDGQV